MRGLFKLKRILITIILLLIVFIGYGCGGGGGGGSSKSSNTKPIANAGLDQNVSVDDIVSLDGSSSSDTDGDPITYEWVITVIPDNSNATLSDPSSITPNFTADIEGEYVITLVVNDGEFASEVDSVTITASTNAENLKEWTYLVYMGGDNNLSTAGLIDLNEMEQIGSDENLNIVLQAEFSNQFTVFADIGQGHSYSGDTLRFLVQQDFDDDDVDLESGTSIGNVDMGAPNTLRDFIKWGTENYPAKRYALVIWDHGAGWKTKSITKGAVEDATSGSFMSLPDLAKAVRDSGVHLDLINFDACLMAMYEVAYEFKGLTDYMVFAEETEPGEGDPYDTILAALAQNPTMNAKDLSQIIVEKFVEYYQISSRDENVTKSAIDMAYIDELDQAVIELSDAIVSNFEINSGAILNALNNTQNYTYPTNYDLYDFSSKLMTNFPSGPIRTAAQKIIDLIGDEDFVVRNLTLGNKVNNSYGLAIYIPQANQISQDQILDELRDYSQLACNQIRSTVWYDTVNEIVMGNEVLFVPGDFGFWIEWIGDADLDLYVWEPLGIYAPWSGQTTPNGFFSGDSSVTGISAEYYIANPYVQEGQYDAIVNYYDDGLFYNYATVSFWFFDPQISNEWQLLGTFTLDMSNPLQDFESIENLNDLNSYSDWLYPGFLTRAKIDDNRSITINTGTRTFNITFRKKKKKPSLENLRR